MDADELRKMQCMEVWGGNIPVSSAVSMNGIDAWVFSQTYENSDGGGDVYYVSACATGRITRLLIADVAGHGMAVQDLAVTLRGLMKRFVNYLDQTRFVQAMNEQFTTLSRSGTFATAIVATYFAGSGHLSLCNAGHPPPLVYRSKSRKWSYLQRQDAAGAPASDLPLGITDEFSYTEFEINLQRGDLVLCYTDAWIEARLPDQELLGREGLLEIINTLGGVKPDGLIASLLAKVTARTGPGGMEGDDLTALLFRINDRRPNFFVRAAGPIRLVREIARELWSGGRSLPLPDMTLPNVGGALFAPLGKLWRGKGRRPSPTAPPAQAMRPLQNEPGVGGEDGAAADLVHTPPNAW